MKKKLKKNRYVATEARLSQLGPRARLWAEKVVRVVNSVVKSVVKSQLERRARLWAEKVAFFFKSCVFDRTCVLILLFMRRHTTIYVFSYYYICVLIPLYVSSCRA